ncbi:IclR family transcriptional regulator domain-containing protein [Gordonia phthalatica]|uniref:IclR family transcriptional regulator n=1 Tax=Gordonia phthalatica TaxID=1136941 RepID=A0A0N9NG85_9ACTN|nr:IclR family transcriptional regulator C-terminal domain-containing protein [Gordonia phthalatica]ALG86123.1 hypothetical protein ACH46_18525 [Gordonia phthalatica]
MQERRTDDRDLVQSLIRGVEVIRIFDGDHSALTLDEASTLSGHSRSATRRLLRTLMHENLVEFDGRLFRLTSHVLELGYVQQSRLPIAEIVAPHCSALAARIRHTVSVAQLDGDEVVYIARANAPRIMAIAVGVGTRLPAHLPAIGRALLAWRSDDELAAYARSATFLENPVATLGDGDALLASLAATREKGWASAFGDLDVGLTAIAAPIRDRSGTIVAAVNIATHVDDLADESVLTDLVPDLLEVAGAIGGDLHARHRA